MTLKNVKLLSNFQDILKAQLDCYVEVLELATKKTSVLVSGDVKALEEITSVEQGMIIKLGKMEEQRALTLEQIALEFKKDPEELKVDFFSRELPGEQAEEFKKIHRDLKEVLDKINQANRTNEQLINRALDYINFSIGLLTEAGTDTSGYGADGSSSAQKTYHFIDKKA